VAEEVSVSPISELDALYSPPPRTVEWTARVSPPEESLSRYVAAFEQQRSEASSEAIDRVLRTAVRLAAVDTGAIEGLYEVDRGFTYTIAAEEATWEAALTEKGPDTEALIRAQLSAYDLVLDAATHQVEMSEAWIRRLHEELCRPQETYEVRTPQGPQRIPLPKGEYKRYPNHVLQADGTEHAYAPVQDTPREMHRLVEELRSDAFTEVSPILQAAFAHYFLVAVHPFADGNGRVARALASVYTYRALWVPVVIYADQRRDYLSTLRSADSGNRQPFVRFVGDRLLDTLAEATQELRAASRPPIEDSIRAIQELNVGCGGLTHAELDTVAGRLLEAVQASFSERIQPLIAAPLGFGMQFDPGVEDVREGYRGTVSQPSRIWRGIVSAAPPGNAAYAVRVQVVVSTARDAPFCFVIQRLDDGDEIEVRLSDAYPDLSQNLQRRLAAWVEDAVADSLHRVRTESRTQLRNQGYPVPDE
jgi:Fic family protein